jgi:hypothetical protein
MNDTPRTLKDAAIAAALNGLASANRNFAAAYPGPRAGRQPVHTIYGGADLFRADSAAKLGAVARQTLNRYAPDFATFAQVVGIPAEPADLAERVYLRVADKLEQEPVEDFRIDFEDGYGRRPDDEEDACAVSAAREVAAGLESGSLPPFVGIRTKPLTDALADRAISTLDIFVTTLLDATGGTLPPGFVITNPKVVVPGQVAALADLCDQLEAGLSLPSGSLKMEIMVETPQSIIGPDGRCAVPGLIAAGRGRCIGAHFGVYDYTAGIEITAHHQDLDHPACDFARHMMQVALSDTGVWLSDGATNVLPARIHRPSPGSTLTLQQEHENRAAVHHAWRLHFRHVMHSLRHAYFQGWDLHPAQLPTRYAALYAFFLSERDAAIERLNQFVGQAARATLTGDVFDDAATGQALLNFFLRGVNCGAFDRSDIERTGLTLAEIEARSFSEIVAARQAS